MSLIVIKNKCLKYGFFIGTVLFIFSFHSCLARTVFGAELYSQSQLIYDIKELSEEALKPLNIKLIAQGKGGMVGVDPIFVDVEIDEAHENRLVERAVEAQEAVSRALAKSKILWNMTNYGVGSLSLVTLQVHPVDKYPLFEVCNKTILKPWGSKPESKFSSQLKEAFLPLLKKEQVLNRFHCYESEIEPGRVALGIIIYIGEEYQKEDDEIVSFYKTAYEALLKWVKEKYPNEKFLMLSIEHRYDKTGKGIYRKDVENIRQHLLFSTSATNPPGTYSHKYYPNVLKNEVPVNLHRDLYVPKGYVGSQIDTEYNP